jgi:hypothetical protein
VPCLGTELPCDQTSHESTARKQFTPSRLSVETLYTESVAQAVEPKRDLLEQWPGSGLIRRHAGKALDEPLQMLDLPHDFRGTWAFVGWRLKQLDDLAASSREFETISPQDGTGKR